MILVLLLFNVIVFYLFAFFKNILQYLQLETSGFWG